MGFEQLGGKGLFCISHVFSVHFVTRVLCYLSSY